MAVRSECRARAEEIKSYGLKKSISFFLSKTMATRFSSVIISNLINFEFYIVKYVRQKKKKKKRKNAKSQISYSRMSPRCTCVSGIGCRLNLFIYCIGICSLVLVSSGRRRADNARRIKKSNYTHTKYAPISLKYFAT